MIPLLFIILLLLPVRSFGMEMIGFGAASCATQSTDSGYTSANGAFGMYGNSTGGQTFTAASSGTKSVYSISVRGLGYAGGAGDLVARIGTTANLSSSYLGETTSQAITFDEVARTYELLFPAGSRPSITNSNLYYITVINTGAGVEDLFEYYIYDAGAYGSGTHWQGGTTQHDVTGGELTDYDSYFIVKVCD